MPKSALIAGGTGLVGRLLVNLLVNSHEFGEIKVIVREGNQYLNPDVTQIKVDFENLPAYKEELKADDVFCCLGTTMKKAGSKDNFYKVDFTYPLQLAKIALENGSLQYNIITASGSNPDSFFFYNRVKGEIEQALREIPFQNLNIFRPSLLLGERNEIRTGEEIAGIAAKVINPLLYGRFKKYRAIHGQTVAKAMFRQSIKGLTGIHVLESDKIQQLGNTE